MTRKRERPHTTSWLLTLFLWTAAFGYAPVAMAQGDAVAEAGSVTGRVTLRAADGVKSAASGVRLILNCEAEPEPRVEIADEQGAFRFERVPVDACTISTDFQGFRSENAAISIPRADLRFHLEVEPVFVSVTATGAASADSPSGCRVAGRKARVRQ